MKVLLTLAGKELKLLARDRFALFWIFAFPLLYAIFFGSIFGSSDGDGSRSRIRIAVVDDDQSEASTELIARLGEHESLRIEREEVDGVEESDAPPREWELEEAREAVRKGQQVAFVRILEDYGDSPFRMFGGADDEGATIELGIDPARSMEAGVLQGVLMETVFGGMAESWSDPATMRAEIDRAREELARESEEGSGQGLDSVQRVVVDTFLAAMSEFYANATSTVLDEGMGGVGGLDLVEKVSVTRDTSGRPLSAYEITFPSAMVWGLMGVAITFAVTLVRERTQGTLLRLRIAPLTRTQLLAGKALSCFVTCLVVMAFLLVFGYAVLGVRFGSPLLLALSMSCTAACFTGVMMSCSVMGKTEQAVAGAAWGVMMPFAMVGGGMIPLIAMPPWLLALSDYSPFKWGIYSMEGAVWRDFALSDMWLPCGLLILFGVVFFSIGVRLFTRADG